MEGYDTILIGNFYAFPEFQKVRGTSEDTVQLSCAAKSYHPTRFAGRMEASLWILPAQLASHIIVS